MEDQVENSYMLQMPTLVIEKILSNVLNLTNVSRTCKYLYDTVCQMEKRKRVACIIRCDLTKDDYERLTIDDDVVLDSIMNSHRTITKIQLNTYRQEIANDKVKLNERHLERVTAIIKHFGANITSLKLRGVSLSIDEIIELLNKTPKLESLEFEYGRAFGSATTTLHLSSLKELSIMNYCGLLEIVNFLPSASLNDFRCLFFQLEDNQQDIVHTILSKQHNLKSLKIEGLSDPVVLCVNNLQLEELGLGDDVYHTDDQLIEILRCHSNLKEFSLEIDSVGVKWPQPSTFEWICENLKELEVLRMAVDSPGKNAYSMLGKLKKLRYFSTNVKTLRDAKFQLRIDSLAKLEIDYFERFTKEEFKKIMQSMVRTFINLTSLDLDLHDFSQLNVVLSQCTKLNHLIGHIYFSTQHHHFAGKSFPNIRHLTIATSNDYQSIQLNFMTSIVRAMPNLKCLSMMDQYAKIIFNVNAVKEFILASKSLEELEVDSFKLDQDLSPDGFVETIRRLSDRLKAYRFRFKAYNGPAWYFKALKDILSDEFNDRGSKKDIVLYKGVLSNP